MKIGVGVNSRWNNASLHTSICPIARSHPSSEVYGSTSENDTGSTLPRAEFHLSPAEATNHSVGSTSRVSLLTINVWHSDSDNLETALDLIEQNYDNCDKAATSPLVVANGNVVRVQFMDRTSGPVNENVYLGTVTFEIEVQRNNTTPA